MDDSFDLSHLSLNRYLNYASALHLQGLSICNSYSAAMLPEVDKVAWIKGYMHCTSRVEHLFLLFWLSVASLICKHVLIAYAPRGILCLAILQWLALIRFSLKVQAVSLQMASLIAVIAFWACPIPWRLPTVSGILKPLRLLRLPLIAVPISVSSLVLVGVRLAFHSRLHFSQALNHVVKGDPC